MRPRPGSSDRSRSTLGNFFLTRVEFGPDRPGADLVDEVADLELGLSQDLMIGPGGHAPEGGVMYAFSAPLTTSPWRRDRSLLHSSASAADASGHGGACGVPRDGPGQPSP